MKPRINVKRYRKYTFKLVPDTINPVNKIGV